MKVNWRHCCVLLVIFCWVGCDEESEGSVTTVGAESVTEAGEEGGEAAEEGGEAAEEGGEAAEEGGEAAIEVEEAAEEGGEAAEEGGEAAEEGGEAAEEGGEAAEEGGEAAEEGGEAAEEGGEAAEEGGEAAEEGGEAAEEGGEAAEEGGEVAEEGGESGEEEVCVSDKVDGDDFTPLFSAICGWEFNCETELNGDPKWETMEDCMAEGSSSNWLSPDMVLCEGDKFQDMIDCYEGITENSCGEKYVDLDCFALTNLSKKNCDYPENYCGDDVSEFWEVACKIDSDPDECGAEDQACLYSFSGYTNTDQCKGPDYDQAIQCMEDSLSNGCASTAFECYGAVQAIVPCNPEEEESESDI